MVVVYPGVIYGPGKVTAGNIVARLVYILASVLHFWLPVERRGQFNLDVLIIAPFWS